MQDQFFIQPDNKNLFEVFKFGNDIDWSQVSVLDYGCNQGNYVKHSKHIVSPDRYLGVDINQASIVKAKTNYPDYEFLHYNQWHPSFNPRGINSIMLSNVLDRKFDVVVAYSVFTHSTIDQTRRQLADLKKLLNPGGCILATFWHVEKFPNFLKFIQHDHSLANFDIDPNTCTRVSYWVDYNNVIQDQDALETKQYFSVCTFYQPKIITTHFRGSKLIGALPIAGVQWLYEIK